MRELPTPKGRYEFKGSEVIGHRRYYDDDGNFIEEVWTKNGKHYMACLKPEDMTPESLFKLIDAELSFRGLCFVIFTPSITGRSD